MAFRGETIAATLLADENFIRLVHQRNERGDRLRAAEIHRMYGGEEFCSRITIERAVKRARETTSPPAPSTRADAVPAPEAKPPTQREQLIAATIAPAVETVRPDPRVEALERQVGILTEQLRWAQRADPTTHTGGKLTLVISDVHLGDRAHMPRCYEQMWDKVLVHAEGFRPDEVTVIDNGDHIAGRGIYRNQNMDAVLQSTEEQVKIGAMDIMRRDLALRERFPESRVRWKLTHGNHDMSMGERTSPMMVLMARTLGVEIVYCGDAAIVNLAAAGTHNLYAEHGFGYSGISPSSPKWFDAMKDKLLVLARTYSGDNRIRRVTHGHTHYAVVGMERILDYHFDTTGGCQRNERVLLGKNSRPMGFIAYVSPAGHDGILQPVLLQPDTELQIAENSDPYLFQRNMEGASEMLQAYDEEITRRGVYERIEPEGR